jgi:hypothetical protein
VTFHSDPGGSRTRDLRIKSCSPHESEYSPKPLYIVESGSPIGPNASRKSVCGLRRPVKSPSLPVRLKSVLFSVVEEMEGRTA